MSTHDTNQPTQPMSIAGCAHLATVGSFSRTMTARSAPSANESTWQGRKTSAPRMLLPGQASIVRLSRPTGIATKHKRFMVRGEHHKMIIGQTRKNCSSTASDQKWPKEWPSKMNDQFRRAVITMFDV